MQTSRRGNKGNIKLRLSCMGRDTGKKNNSFSKSLQSSDFVAPKQHFIGKINPGLDQLKPNF